VDSGSEKKVVRVNIFQQPYTLRVSGEPGETERLAQIVDNLMNQIASRTSGAEPARVAVLASLHLADRVRGLERELQLMRDRLDSLDHHISSVLSIEEQGDTDADS
jgi:cell division protein ZapA (FtsZ GTPase activity inhibitor)